MTQWKPQPQLPSVSYFPCDVAKCAHDESNNAPSRISIATSTSARVRFTLIMRSVGNSMATSCMSKPRHLFTARIGEPWPGHLSGGRSKEVTDVLLPFLPRNAVSALQQMAKTRHAKTPGGPVEPSEPLLHCGERIPTATARRSRQCRRSPACHVHKLLPPVLRWQELAGGRRNHVQGARGKRPG